MAQNASESDVEAPSARPVSDQGLIAVVLFTMLYYTDSCGYLLYMPPVTVNLPYTWIPTLFLKNRYISSRRRWVETQG